MVRSYYRRGRADQRGNTLVLFPAAILIVLGLGALAVDSAVLFLAQRSLADVAATVANDSVAAVSTDAFYDPSGSSIELDEDRAELRARQVVEGAASDRSLEGVTCEVVVSGLRADVACQAIVRPLLAPFWPGLGAIQRITARDSAIAVMSR